MNLRRLSLIAVPYLWLFGLFFVPFLIVFKISLSDIALSIPPYTPTLELSEGWAGFKDMVSKFDFENFEFLATDDRRHLICIIPTFSAFLDDLKNQLTALLCCPFVKL